MHALVKYMSGYVPVGISSKYKILEIGIHPGSWYGVIGMTSGHLRKPESLYMLYQHNDWNICEKVQSLIIYLNIMPFTNGN